MQKTFEEVDGLECQFHELLFIIKSDLKYGKSATCVMEDQLHVHA